MIVIHADQIDGWWSPPPHQRELKILLSPALQSVSEDLSMGMVILPPKESGDPHIHQESQEVWYIISGRGILIVGGEATDLEPDTVVVAPASAEHQIINDSDEELKALFIFSPAGPEEVYFPKED